ncbi:MAG: hypothetical protein EXR62_16215 [Chloroflexi bacterium]|nr:hypothetical protein [Chloroflexota bacterium]
MKNQTRLSIVIVLFACIFLATAYLPTLQPATGTAATLKDISSADSSLFSHPAKDQLPRPGISGNAAITATPRLPTKRLANAAYPYPGPTFTPTATPTPRLTPIGYMPWVTKSLPFPR